MQVWMQVKDLDPDEQKAVALVATGKWKGTFPLVDDFGNYQHLYMSDWLFQSDWVLVDTEDL